MNYEIMFYVLIAFFAGRASVGFSVYAGTDTKKYEKSTIGFLFRKR